jgi:hypothetical protein
MQARASVLTSVSLGRLGFVGGSLFSWCSVHSLCSTCSSLLSTTSSSLMYKLNVLASARVVCNIMGVQVQGRSHRELCS